DQESPPRRGRHAAGFAGQVPQRRAVDPQDAQAAKSSGIIVLIPVFNDWDSRARLLPKLDVVLAGRGVVADVLVLDDGSPREPDAIVDANPFSALARVDVLRLRRNLGHQRAIAVGLAYLEDCLGCDTVVIMDGDGEDAPADVPRLLDRLAAE